MTKFRCFADVPELIPGRLVLPPDESNHVAAVMRVGEGETLLVLNGRGQEARGCVLRADKRAVELELSDCRRLSEPDFQTTVCIGLPKLSAMDTILQKSTELGVRRIVPILSAHSVVKLSPEKREARVARWEKILLGAVKQCRNPWLPEVLPVSSFEDACRVLPDQDCSFVGSLEEGALSFKGTLRSIETPRRVSIWIGPEGDFSANEYTQLRDAGVVGVSFGDRILRAETAVLSALSVLNYEFERS